MLVTGLRYSVDLGRVSYGPPNSVAIQTRAMPSSTGEGLLRDLWPRARVYSERRPDSAGSRRAGGLKARLGPAPRPQQYARWLNRRIGRQTNSAHLPAVHSDLRHR
jgi:hypothetical protein